VVIIAVIGQQVISVWAGEHERQHIAECKQASGNLIQTQDSLMCVGGKDQN